MKRMFIILVLVSFASQGWAQETYHHQFSKTPESARYEIVQSEFGARITLKIDKYDGMVYLLVEGKTGLSWELMQVAEHTKDDIAAPGKVNYQVFTSGLGPRFTFLLNVNTGATWQLSEDSKSEELFWIVLE